jgi:hypothetical protein
MKKTFISVTDAARNFADCTGPELAEALRQVDLPEDEARAWHKDLMAARKTLKPPRDRWR